MSDFETVFAHWCDPQVGRWLFDDKTPTRDEVEKELLQAEKLLAQSGVGIWGLHHHGSSRLFGTAGFLDIPETGEIEILFSIDPTRWRQGYAHEASLTVLDQAFKTAGLESVVGRCDVPNQPSKRLLEKLGMTWVKTEPIRGIDCHHYLLRGEDYLRST